MMGVKSQLWTALHVHEGEWFFWMPSPSGTLSLSVSNWYKVQIISLCLSWQIDGFAAVVGRNIIDGRGKAGRLRRAPTPSGRPTKAAMQLRLVPLSPSLCSCQTQRKVEAEEEADKRSCKVGGFWSEGNSWTICSQRHTSILNFNLKRLIRSRM